jgi:hypothetical protein
VQETSLLAEMTEKFVKNMSFGGKQNLSFNALPSTKSLIRVGRPDDATDLLFVDEIVKFVNAAYIRGEDKMWKEGKNERTDADYVKKMLGEGRLLYLCELGKPIACILCDTEHSWEKKDETTGVKIGELGMLAVRED